MVQADYTADTRSIMCFILLSLLSRVLHGYLQRLSRTQGVDRLCGCDLGLLASVSNNLINTDSLTVCLGLMAITSPSSESVLIPARETQLLGLLANCAILKYESLYATYVVLSLTLASSHSSSSSGIAGSRSPIGFLNDTRVSVTHY